MKLNLENVILDDMSDKEAKSMEEIKKGQELLKKRT